MVLCELKLHYKNTITFTRFALRVLRLQHIYYRKYRIFCEKYTYIFKEQMTNFNYKHAYELTNLIVDTLFKTTSILIKPVNRYPQVLRRQSFIDSCLLTFAIHFGVKYTLI